MVSAMLFRYRRKPGCTDPRDGIRAAAAVTPELVSELIAQCGICLQGPHSSQAARLRRLIAAEAWTDVALALVEIALPEWRLVRLVVDDGEWCCALSRHWQVPDWLDDAVEARHEVLPLAILAAFAGAHHASRPARLRSVPTLWRRASKTVDPVCCDNFC